MSRSPTRPPAGPQARVAVWALHLASKAPPGGVVIGEATYAALGSAASVEDLGRIQVRGKSGRIGAYGLLALVDSAADARR